MRLGSAEISIVSDGVFRVDGAAVFGVVPKTIWSELRQPDRKNRVELGLNCMLIRSGDKCVLVDTGIGTKPDRNMRSNYGMRAGKLVENLALRGVRPEDVDLVILTHLHFDHAGGCTRYGRGGSAATPVFPKATHLVQRADWEEASTTNERTRAAYNPHDFAPLEQSGNRATGTAGRRYGSPARPVGAAHRRPHGWPPVHFPGVGRRAGRLLRRRAAHAGSSAT